MRSFCEVFLDTDHARINYYSKMSGSESTDEAFEIARAAVLTEAEIAEIEAQEKLLREEKAVKVAKLHSLRTRFAELVRQGQSQGPAQQGGSNRESQVKPGSIAERTAAVLNSEPNKPMSPSEVQQKLGTDVDIGTIRSTLNRIAKDNRIRRVGHGQYQGLASDGGKPDHEGEMKY